LTLVAEMDCVVVVSACPMDLNAINGVRPTQLAVEIDHENPLPSKEI
jgi:uncharacterized protein YcgI (DUF1989 family)